MIGIILGTRPGIIKMSPIIRECNNWFILHTGQPYSYEMDNAKGAQTGKMQLQKVLLKEF
ncbi:MAG: hypothetical protein ACE5KT_01320 [Methanosarcinales archaeon]